MHTTVKTNPDIQKSFVQEYKNIKIKISHLQKKKPMSGFLEGVYEEKIILSFFLITKYTFLYLVSAFIFLCLPFENFFITYIKNFFRFVVFLLENT